MKILIDKATQRVTGHNESVTPFCIGIDVVDTFNISKVIQVQAGFKHKVNDHEQLLYKDNIIIDELSGDESYDEVFTKEKVITFNEVPRLYKSVDEEGNETDINTVEKVPVEVEQLDPVMIPNMINKVVTLVGNPTEFTAEEILIEIYQGILDETEMDYILADVFLSEDDIDLESPSHAANTGPGLVQLLPGGQCKLKQTNLACASKSFRLIELDADDGIEVYIAGKKFENGFLALTSEIESCTIKFINTTDKPKQIHSFAIVYQEVTA